MSFLGYRRKRIERTILGKIARNSKKVGFSIIFKSQESPLYVYRFIGNTYVVANLENLNWSVVKYINELSWDELKKIEENLTFIRPQDANKWLSQKKKSILLLMMYNFRKFFIKEPQKKYYL